MAEVMGFFDVFSFVQSTIPVIESTLSVKVTSQGTAELVNRMRPHENQVSMDIASGTITPSALEDILRGVIRKAASFSPGSPISPEAISKAIATECQYLGWC